MASHSRKIITGKKKFKYFLKTKNLIGIDIASYQIYEQITNA